MSNSTSGRPSIKQKQQAQQAANRPVDETDMLAVDPRILADIESKGMTCRWINAVKLKANYGFDARQWVPYKSEVKLSDSFGFTDSEGYVRRGDLVLAVQSKEIAARRKAKIEDRNRRMQNAQGRQAADQLRKSFSDAGIDAKIHEGYDENE